MVIFRSTLGPYLDRARDFVASWSNKTYSPVPLASPPPRALPHPTRAAHQEPAARYTERKFSPALPHPNLVGELQVSIVKKEPLVVHEMIVAAKLAIEGVDAKSPVVTPAYAIELRSDAASLRLTVRKREKNEQQATLPHPETLLLDSTEIPSGLEALQHSNAGAYTVSSKNFGVESSYQIFLGSPPEACFAKEFTAAVRASLPEYSLYANPRYPGNVLAKKVNDAGLEIDESVHILHSHTAPDWHYELLLNIADWNIDWNNWNTHGVPQGENFIYYANYKVPTPKRFLLPWHVRSKFGSHASALTYRQRELSDFIDANFFHWVEDMFLSWGSAYIFDCLLLGAINADPNDLPVELGFKFSPSLDEILHSMGVEPVSAESLPPFVGKLLAVWNYRFKQGEKITNDPQVVMQNGGMRHQPGKYVYVAGNMFDLLKSVGIEEYHDALEEEIIQPVRDENRDAQRQRHDEAPVIATEEKATTPNSIKREGGFTTKSGPVLIMKREVEEGRPTPFYELMQGMVDYGRDHKNPPRVFVAYENGVEIEWDGGELREIEKITALKFENHGPGLAPADAVTDEHEEHDGRAGKLGTHGRGTPITLTYLAMMGMPVTIESNRQGRAWRATTQLAPQEGKESLVMQIAGDWLDKPSDSTCFTIHNPKEFLLKLLPGMGNYFLYANPKFDDAVVVPAAADRPVPVLDENIGPGRVTCLAGIVDWDVKSRKADSIFVDGLNLTTHMSALFPWHVTGFKDEARHSALFVRRNDDSSGIDGAAVGVVNLAIRRTTSRDLLEKLIVAATTIKDKWQLPLELREPQHMGKPSEDFSKLSDTTRALLKSIWAERFGNASIAREEIKEGGAKKADVVVVLGSLYDMLVQAGISQSHQANLKNDMTERPITVAYADGIDRLQRLFTEAGIAGGNVVINEVGGVKVAQISFPYGFFDLSDLDDRQKPGLQWLRAAAVIAKKARLSASIYSQDDVRQAKIEINVKEKSGKFFTPIAITTENLLDKTDATTETVITLSGEVLQNCEPSIAELAKIAAEAKNDRKTQEQKRLAAIPFIADDAAIKRQQALDAETKRLKAEAEKIEAERKKQALRAGLLATAKIVKEYGVLVAGGTTLILGAVAAGMMVLDELDMADKVSESAAAYLDERFPVTMPVLAPRTPHTSIEGELLLSTSGNSTSGVGVSVTQVYRIVDTLPQNFKKQPLPATAVSGKPAIDAGIDDFVSGYWSLATYSELTLGKDNHLSWQPVNEPKLYTDFTVGAPKDFAHLTRVALDSPDEPMRVLTRDGETITAIDTSDNAQISVWRDAVAGDFYLTGISSEVTVYTKKGEAKFNSPIMQSDLQNSVVVEKLNARWQALITAVNADKTLTNADKMAIMLYEFNQHANYSTDPKLDAASFGRTLEDAAAQMLNTYGGKCNGFATAVAIPARAVGVPVRYKGGQLVHSDNSLGTHAYIEFWDEVKSEWVKLEPQVYPNKEQIDALITTGKDPKGFFKAMAKYHGWDPNDAMLTSLTLVHDHADAIKRFIILEEPAVVVPPMDAYDAETFRREVEKNAHRTIEAQAVSWERSALTVLASTFTGIALGWFFWGRKKQTDKEENL